MNKSLIKYIRCFGKKQKEGGEIMIIGFTTP